jgi:DNA mismatch repair protein MutS
LEVSRTNIGKVPPEWIRKQTLANGERYITPSLKEQEEKLLHAEERILALESKLYAELVHQVAAYGPTVSLLSEALAHLDAVAALAEVAVDNGFVRPVLSGDDTLEIKGGRHPVIEKQIGRDRFIPNDLSLDAAARRIVVITGPNMAGKSTYLRQSALIVIMAQMGSFVPAESARIGIVDRVFTRIGASDRLAQGQSTFMVEMQEVATLLHNATPRSLLVLDEVGRGTSTYDGVSIAWAVIDHLSKMPGDEREKNSSEPRGADSKGPRTLFATHYFELTQLAESLSGVFNAHVTAKEWPGPDGRRQVVFLYQIQPGAADRSYGIHVAEMAGLPDGCIERARAILHQLESGSHALGAPAPAAVQAGQLDFFAANHPAVDDLRALRIDTLTPLEALNVLAKLKAKAGG